MHNFNLNFIPRRKGVYIVGGSVRDALRGHPPKDHDIAVIGDAYAVAEEVAANAGCRVVEIGKAEKCIYRVPAGAGAYDVSAAKAQTVEEDLRLRDFTINAMAFDVYHQTLIDPLNGRADLDAGMVRMICPEAFENDPLRLLRAFRIAALLGFAISPDTLKEIRKMAPAITTVAGERIREEWIKLLGAPDSFTCISKMADTGLLEALFPELLPLKNCPGNAYHEFNAFDHVLAVYRHIEALLHPDATPLYDRCGNSGLLNGPDGVALIKHAALFHDIGKPAVCTTDRQGQPHFYGHETTGGAISDAISNRLCFSSAEKRYASFLIRHHLRPLLLYIAMSEGRRKNRARARFFIRTRPYSTDLLLLFAADMMGKNTDRDITGALAFVQDTIAVCRDTFQPRAEADPLVTGHDLVSRFGLSPSPLIAETLDKLEVQRIAGNIESRKEALAFSENFIKGKNLS